MKEVSLSRTMLELNNLCAGNIDAFAISVSGEKIAIVLSNEKFERMQTTIKTAMDSLEDPKDQEKIREELGRLTPVLKD